MTRRITNPAYIRLLRATRAGTPTYREFDRDLQGTHALDVTARLDASAVRGF